MTIKQKDLEKAALHFFLVLFFFSSLITRMKIVLRFDRNRRLKEKKIFLLLSFTGKSDRVGAASLRRESRLRVASCDCNGFWSGTESARFGWEKACRREDIRRRESDTRSCSNYFHWLPGVLVWLVNQLALTYYALFILTHPLIGKKKDFVQNS